MPFGLHCLYSRDETPLEDGDGTRNGAVDIVAVHGLNEDSVTTWVHQESRTSWLETLLPQKLPNARVLTFGYDSSPSSFTGPDFAERVESHATTLVAALEADRKLASCNHRPIIFICHGLGGIIVKSALVHAASQTSSFTSHRNSIYVSTFAILFFGTPHDSIDISKWLPPRSSSKGSPLTRHSLETITNQFAPLVKKFHTYLFWEGIPTQSSRSADFVVEQSSAAPTTYETERSGIPDATHSGMVKLHKTHSAYKTVLSALERYCRAAPAVIARRWIEATESLRRERQSEAAELIGFSINIPDKVPMSPRQKSGAFENKAANEYFMPPCPVSADFIGRDKVLDTLTTAFHESGNTSSSEQQKRFVLYGLGGSGKTQLAAKYAQDNRWRYWAIFTVDATSPETAEESFRRIGSLGGLAATESSGKYFLCQTHKPWLLIIDNADRRDIKLKDLIPPGERGHVLVTTRNPNLRRQGNFGSMELKGLREEEALHLLLKIADIAEPWDASTKAAGNQITRTLGYLALAVIQAGNSIYQKLCNLGDYLGWHEHYRRKRQQSHAPGTNQNTVSQHDDENEDVYSAFDFSFQYIEARNTVPSQDAIEILNIVGFLHFDRIPIDLFTRGIDLRRKQFSQFHNGLLTAKIVSAIANRLKPPPPLPRMLKRGPDDMDPFCVREALWELYAFSLIVYDKDGESFSLHPLVHSWAKDRIPQPERELWAMIAFHTLMASVPLPGSGGGAPDSDFETGLIPHLNACLDACPKEFRGFHGLRLGPFRAFAAKFFQPSLLLTLRDEIQNAAKCGALYAKTGNFSKAAYYLSIAKGALTELLGSDDSRTTAAKLGLAAMLWGLGRLEEGISLQKEVVQSRSKMLGPEHRETLQAMDSLGHSYWLNGQYVEALSLQNETAQKMARSLGENDDDTLNAFDHLGVTLSSWHRYEESRELHQAVLEYRKRTLGQNHLKTLETMNNLAMALLDLKQIDDAKTLMEYVYENRKTQMGKEHPYTLWALCYLSKIYVKKGLLQLAEGILTEGIAAGKRSLDDDHLGVLMGCGELSRLYARQGRLEEAKKLSLETLKKIKKSRGAEHPDYAYGMWKLGQLYALGKESMKAIAAHKVALESIKARLTTEHPLYALVRESLACLINQPGSTGGEEVEVPHPAIASCTSAVA